MEVPAVPLPSALAAGTAPELEALFGESSNVAATFLQIELDLNLRLKELSFTDPVRYIYNPLEYAWDPHQCYVNKYCQARKEVLFLGMNPGPFGMAQTGVPFGEVKHVREWLGVNGLVGRPAVEHPKRPVRGLDCPQSEVSGARFWGFFKSLCGEPDVFFRHCFVHNHCPLVFMGETGRNLTPGELPAAQREQLLRMCDQALCQSVRALGVRTVVGVGKFAEQRARRALNAEGVEVRVEGVMHPSPRNPQANRAWQSIVTAKLEQLQIMPLLKGGKPSPLLTEPSGAHSLACVGLVP
ncbi:single-strand-selective monofunctional uracil-DNA glycosylase 1 [Callorhinchus milii]|uniref:single-strand-selective monofunctional uracil-DNA glycosylase 1 n=1 Tax=Callorhinchus milii TaxID=7868 RepID=UPI001C3F72B7|nr:single-strand-selective monofunctional uracil-DNA glycosylase 1 [Callorhinchus milii]XP_042200215.1 single-strand-selective monofunctional uracil-DNA glycosylase 1 [Callorhinchus milii]